MGVAVYPLLGELLRDRNMTITDLEREIGRQYGITVGRETLERLTQPAPIDRADMAIAGAVAEVLDVGLDDLFDVRAIRNGQDGESRDRLRPSEARALARLFRRQEQGLMTDEERGQLGALVAKQARLVDDDWLRRIAADQGQSIEQVRAEVEGDVRRALDAWHALQDDPDGQSKAIEQAKDLPRAWPA